MALTGNTRELSLADLVVVKASDGGDHRIRLEGPAGDGLLLIESGAVVHAAYGDLPARDAVYVLLTEQNVDFVVESDAEISGHTLSLGPQELLIEAMRRFDEGTLRRPRTVDIPVPGATSNRREPPRPKAHETRRNPEADALRRAMGRVLFAEAAAADESERRWPKIAAVVVGILLAAGGYALAHYYGWLVPAEYRLPAEASDLTGPRDRLPVLMSGAPPVTPRPEDTVLPTVLCRILVDTRGNVHEARLYEIRSGYEAFQEAALVAVAGYRFTPALREGIAVPVWIVWPVDFTVPAVSHEPLPVEVSHFNATRDDRVPAFVAGTNPEVPIKGSRRRPRITCRLLVDIDGTVRDARVLKRRDDLKPYQDAAVAAVKQFRFTPGLREGILVPVWVNWTVEFQ